MNDAGDGLLIGGRIVPIAGVTIRNPRTHAHCRLDSGDYRMRQAQVNKTIWHTTMGMWPQVIVDETGSPLDGKNVADIWHRDPQHSAAQLVISGDGSIDCLGDLQLVAAYHAGTSNETSVGVEIKQEKGGIVHRASLETAAKLAPVLSREFDFAFQITCDPYQNTIIERLKLGGPDCVGHFGHRDQAWAFPSQMTAAQLERYPNGYAARGRGDPGDELYNYLRAAGAEPFRFALREDIAAWKRRQAVLNAKGANLRVDGIAGRSTIRAMRQYGYVNGRAIAA